MSNKTTNQKIFELGEKPPLVDVLEKFTHFV